MPWIKKNPHLLTLILVSLGVAGASVMLVLSAQSFDKNFEPARENPPQGATVYQQSTDDVDSAKVKFQKPNVWSSAAAGSLFVSVPYEVDTADNTKLKLAGEGSRNKDSFPPNPFIPDKWFNDNKLPVYNPEVTRQDPDGDGFYNEDEWRGKTDPNDPKSHPPYTTKLFLKRFIKVPFLLKFQSYDGDPKKPEEMSFQINTLSLRQPSEFLKIGDMVSRTKFKILAFEPKMVVKNDIEVDISELTIVDTETSTQLKLIMNTVIDSPDSYALFTYIHPKPAKDIQVKKLKEFILLPEKDLRYKLLDVGDTEALIQTPSGEKVTISTLPAGYTP